MRADSLVRALSRHYAIHLRVIPIQEMRSAAGPVAYAGPCATQQRVWLSPSLIHRIRFRKLGELARLAPRIHESLDATLTETKPEVIFAFRHCLLAAGMALRDGRAPGARLIVDLDELESNSRGRLAALHAARGERNAAAAARVQSSYYRSRERTDLPGDTAVWTCSEVEAAHLCKHTGVASAVVPNVVRLPPLSRRARRDEADPVTLLFVGGLHYLPNRDGAGWMIEQVLPRLRHLLPVPVRIRIVGKAPAKVARWVSSQSGVEWRGHVELLGPEYAAADLCVVPLRAGGGSRIKLLEALAYRRPVVSTLVGAEGLRVRDNVHLCLADDADSFALACARLLERHERAERTAASGRQLVADHYGQAALENAVAHALCAVARNRVR